IPPSMPRTTTDSTIRRGNTTSLPLSTMTLTSRAATGRTAATANPETSALATARASRTSSLRRLELTATPLTTQTTTCRIMAISGRETESPHHQDQLRVWLQNRCRPMLFHPDDVEANTELILRLRPSESP